MTYEQAMAQLEKLARQMESGEPNIDTLAENLKEAQQLIAQCRQKLQSVDEEIKKTLEKDK